MYKPQLYDQRRLAVFKCNAKSFQPTYIFKCAFQPICTVQNDPNMYLKVTMRCACSWLRIRQRYAVLHVLRKVQTQLCDTLQMFS